MDYKTPGQLIAALLTERGWTQRVLAIVLGMDETGVNKMVSDKRSVDANLALVLEEVFHVPAERFLELQRSFDLAKARITTRPDPGRATRALLYGDLPVGEMIKRGWINAENVRDTAKVEAELMRFFNANRVEDIEILLTLDLDHWNSVNPEKKPINLPMDLTLDIEIKKAGDDGGAEAA